MDADFLRNEAARLLNDTVLQTALKSIRSGALESLATCDPRDDVKIMQMQARVSVCDDMQAELSRMVNSAAERDPFKAV